MSLKYHIDRRVSTVLANEHRLELIKHINLMEIRFAGLGGSFQSNNGFDLILSERLSKNARDDRFDRKWPEMNSPIEIISPSRNGRLSNR